MEKDDNTQHEKKTNQKSPGKFLDGKGFYIVLSVCAVIIAVSAGMLIWGGGDGWTDVGSLNNAEDYVNATADSGKLSGGSDLADAPDTGKDMTDTGSTTPDTDVPDLAETGATDPEDTFSEAVATMSVTSPEDESETAATGGELKFIWPLSGSVAVEYSVDELIYDKTMMDWRTHSGLDIEAAIGTKVMAVADGSVAEVREDDMYGTTVVIDHGGGLMSIYSNLAKVPTVNTGDTVAMGSVIGAVGDTAIAEAGEVAHLHLAMTLSDESADPGEYLPKRLV